MINGTVHTKHNIKQGNVGVQHNGINHVANKSSANKTARRPKRNEPTLS